MGGWTIDDVRSLDKDYYDVLLRLLHEGKIKPMGF